MAAAQSQGQVHGRRQSALPWLRPPPRETSELLLRRGDNWTTSRIRLSATLSVSSLHFHSKLWQQVAGFFMLKLKNVGCALDVDCDSSKSEDAFISLLSELKAYSDNLLHMFTSPISSVPNFHVDCHASVLTDTKSVTSATLTSANAAVVPPGDIVATGNLSHVPDPQIATSKRPFGNIDGNLRSPLVCDPLARGRDYLRRNAGNLPSETTARIEPDDPPELWENFSQLLILEATNDPTLVKLVEPLRVWNFFHDKKFPCDIDTTSIGLVSLRRDPQVTLSIIHEMLDYVNSDGIILTYFDHTRPRVDPVVCINALTLFYSYGCGEYLPRTLEWIHTILLERTYLQGTRYYTTAECFLFFLSRLITYSTNAELNSVLRPLLRERVQERIGEPGDALALAMRIIVCNAVGLKNEADIRTLLSLQGQDGSWEVGWIYQIPTAGILVGNKGLTTALALKALTTISSLSLDVNAGSC